MIVVVEKMLLAVPSFVNKMLEGSMYDIVKIVYTSRTWLFRALVESQGVRLVPLAVTKAVVEDDAG